MQTEIPRPCVCTSIRRVSRILARAYDHELSHAGVNATQFALMRGIERHRGEPLAHVADDLCMDRTSLYRSLKPLMKQRWIAIGSCGNAHSRCARITPKGKRILNLAAPHWAAVQQRTVERFGREKWQHFICELERLRTCAGTISLEMRNGKD